MESPFNQIALRSPFFDTGLSAFTPLSLFSASEPGAWYDPSDMSTMFQDFNGATAVTAVEQPVSVILDKSKSGVGTNGTRRLNLLTYSEQFDNAAWTKTSITISANTTETTDPLGGNTADILTENSTAGTFCAQNVTVTGGVVTTYSVAVKYKNNQWFRLLLSDNGSNSILGWFDVQNGVLGSVSSTGASSPSSSITPLGNGWYRCSVTAGFAATTRSNSLNNVSADASSTRVNNGASYIWGADLRLAADVNIAPTYQRVTDTWYNVQAGSHAYTPSTATASRPVLSARYNLLTKTEEFDNAAWDKGLLVTISSNATTDPLGGNTADKLIETSSTSFHYLGVGSANNIVFVIGVGATFAVYAKASERSVLQIAAGTGDISGNGRANFNLSNGTLGTVDSGITASITDAGNGWYRCTVDFVAQSTAINMTIGIVTSTTAARFESYAGNGTDGLFIWGADLRVANDGVSIPTYQRVNTSTDYDTTNFPMYLRFDGSDDYMLTGTITPGTDKAQVFAGVRKLSDAALGIVAELSVTSGDNNGTFTFYAPYTPPTSFGFRSKGTTLVDAITGSNSDVAPTTKVQTGIGDISGDISRLRLNGTQINQNTSDQGTGNYLAYPLYIGRRGGTASPFNGRLYGMIVRFGANLDNTQITNTETWMNGKTRAF